MDGFNPFKPGGPTVALLGSTPAPGGTLLGLIGDWSVYAFNRSSSTDAYLAYGLTSASVATAVVPVVGAPGNATQNVIELPFRTGQTFTFSGPTFFRVVVPAGANAIVDLTPGGGS